MSADFTFASIGELSQQVKQRSVSSVELTRAALDRTQKLDKILNTYITLLPEAALGQAKLADAEISRGHYRGPLHGIPISIKDHIDTAGITTTGGAKSRENNIPTKDAAVVTRLKDAGTILLGKANMNKFASGESGENVDFGNIRNPWNTDCSPGGSSGGSGAQVAAGLVPLSIGSDNGGSVRIPAALCGVVGMKPTHGRVSLEGIFPRLYSFDHPGPLTRTVQDCAIAMQVISGHNSGDTTTARKPVPDYSKDLRAGIKKMRFGVDLAFASVGQPEVLAAFQKAIDALRGLGASVSEVTIPSYDKLLAIGNTIAACEFAVAGAELFRANPADFDAGDTGDMKSGSIIPAVDYIRATQQRRILQIEYARATRDLDVFLAPSYPLSRRPFGAYPKVQGRDFTIVDAFRYTFPFDLLGVPALSVPCGFSAENAPIGIQFITRAFDESTALRAAYAYEQSTVWHTRHPKDPVV